MPTPAGPSSDLAAIRCAPAGRASSGLLGAADGSLLSPSISWMPKPVHLGGGWVAPLFGWWLLSLPFAPREVFSDRFKLSDSTAPCFPVMVSCDERAFYLLLLFSLCRLAGWSPVHDPLCNTQESFRKWSFYPTGPSQQEAGSQQPISCKDSGFLWIMDALYALSDTYLHFPQDCMDERGQGFRLETEREGGELKKLSSEKRGEKRKRLRTEIKWRKKKQEGFTFVFSFFFSYRGVNYEYYGNKHQPV